MTTIRIFLASSAELESERKEFALFLYNKSKEWVNQRDTFLKMLNWEDFIDAMSKTRLQDEYNNAIKGSDLFVMLFWTKVGKYTEEEFDTAWKQFKDSGKPLIYVYFKDVPSSEPEQASLEQFKKKLEGHGHFKTEFKTTDGLLLHFSGQLDKLYVQQTPAVEVEKQKIKTDKQKIVDHINKGEIVEAFEEMNKYMLHSNDVLNALEYEFMDQPNNFKLGMFSSKLKLFLNKHW